jgi:hypothetical protein
MVAIDTPRKLNAICVMSTTIGDGERMIRHYWRGLPGPVWFSGADIYAAFVASAEEPALAVELGAWKGRSTCFMGVEIANSGKSIEFWTVDTWLGSPGETGYEDCDLEGGTLFEAFSANIKPVAQHVRPIRADTVEAAAQFADSSIAFLYLDASHTYDGVMRDLHAWFPKMKIGGTIAGDDWCNEQGGQLGVRNAVNDFFGPHRSEIQVLSGSDPNPDWLQWSIVKSAKMQPASIAMRRIHGLSHQLGRVPRKFAALARRLTAVQ